VVNASASLLEGLESDSRPSLTTTLQSGVVVFFSGAWCVEKLQTIRQAKTSEMIKDLAKTSVVGRAAGVMEGATRQPLL